MINLKEFHISDSTFAEVLLSFAQNNSNGKITIIKSPEDNGLYFLETDKDGNLKKKYFLRIKGDKSFPLIYEPVEEKYNFPGLKQGKLELKDGDINIAVVKTFEKKWTRHFKKGRRKPARDKRIAMDYNSAFSYLQRENKRIFLEDCLPWIIQNKLEFAINNYLVQLLDYRDRKEFPRY